jgi:hypothetical protein
LALPDIVTALLYRAVSLYALSSPKPERDDRIVARSFCNEPSHRLDAKSLGTPTKIVRWWRITPSDDSHEKAFLDGRL